jgi:hypothetical protein
MYDMIDYILYYSLLISIGVFCTCVIYMVFFGNNKVVLGFFIFSTLTFLLTIIYPNFTDRPHRPHHCNCKVQFEAEAYNISAAISNYFAIPSRTQIPNISDLVNSGDYTLLENRDLKHKKLVKESEFSVAILGDAVSEITIVVSSKEGACPFEKGKCTWSKGEVYVKKMRHSGDWLDSIRHRGVWLDSYEEN